MLRGSSGIKENLTRPEYLHQRALARLHCVAKRQRRPRAFEQRLGDEEPQPKSAAGRIPAPHHAIDVANARPLVLERQPQTLPRAFADVDAGVDDDDDLSLLPQPAASNPAATSAPIAPAQCLVTFMWISLVVVGQAVAGTAASPR